MQSQGPRVSREQPTPQTSRGSREPFLIPPAAEDFWPAVASLLAAASPAGARAVAMFRREAQETRGAPSRGFAGRGRPTRPTRAGGQQARIPN